MDPVLIAFLGTLFGGVGVKLVDHFLNRNKVKEDFATTIRNEIRTELVEVRTRLDVQEAETAEWRTKYYTILEQFIQVKSELNFTLKRIKELVEQGIIDWTEFSNGIDTDEKD